MSKELKSELVRVAMSAFQTRLEHGKWEVAVITSGVIQVKRLDNPPSYYEVRVVEKFS